MKKVTENPRILNNGDFSSKHAIEESYLAIEQSFQNHVRWYLFGDSWYAVVGEQAVAICINSPEDTHQPREMVNNYIYIEERLKDRIFLLHIQFIFLAMPTD